MKKDMTSGREWSTVLAFSLPIMGANLLQVLYNFADSVIVGNFINPTALGAVGLTSSMTWLLVAFCSALGSGTNIATAQYFGAKKETEIKETISAAYLMTLILSVVLTGVCFLLAKPLKGRKYIPAGPGRDANRQSDVFPDLRLRYPLPASL